MFCVYCEFCYSHFFNKESISLKMIKKTLVLLALSCMGLANNAVSQSLESSKDIYFQDEFLLTQIHDVINFSDGPGNPKDWWYLRWRTDAR